MPANRSMWSPSCDDRPRNVSWLCIHTQEGNGSADSLARYLCNPGNEVSYNTVGDTRETIDVVPFNLSPWAAMGANGRADHYCMAGSFSGWSRDEWLRSGLIDNAARWVAERARARGIPLDYVGTNGVRTGARGVIGHVDWTRGAGEGSHTDPGPNFPWDVLIDKARGAGGVPMVHGAIGDLYNALGGPGGILGKPKTAETATPDKVGRFNHFERGSIYWTPKLGAHEVHGAIRDKWAALGWELCPFLGYPISNELPTAPGHPGAFNVFERGSIYWSPATGAHEIRGAIRDHWAAQGYETGPLGFPTSDEVSVSVGRGQTFQGGTLRWASATNTVTKV